MNEITKVYSGTGYTTADAATRREITDSWIRRTEPDDPTFILDPTVIAANLGRFQDQLDADILYAVKCNPHKTVLKALHTAGVRRFDAASLPEIQTVKSIGHDVHCHFNHPIKSRRAIHDGAITHGVRHFTIDCMEELTKIAETIEPDGTTLHVRIGLPSASSCCGATDKFGATEAEALDLLQQASRLRFALGLSFHVGSQCRDPERYIKALEALSGVVDRTDVTIGWINCGGGFPAGGHAGTHLLVQTILEALAVRLTDLRARTGARVLIEPGRALVAEAVSLVVRVHQRRGLRLYLNDGIYGALSKGCCGCEPAFSTRPIGAHTGQMAEFSIFGPTCDSTDRLERRWLLPDSIAEGDWIAIEAMGAYAGALATRFNGFHHHQLIAIDEMD
jgi:ornithine decarboxylase